jgi:CRISPR system Cascade subunit CasE
MYFSVIEPAEGAEREAAHARLSGPYAEHQWLWRFFPAPAGTARDFIFRRIDVGSGGRFYVMSAREPVLVDAAWSIRTREFAPVLHSGQRLSFEVRVNPVVTVQRDGKARRNDVVMHRKKQLLRERGLTRWSQWKDPTRPAEYDVVTEACREWLCGAGDQPSRARKAGFRVLDETLRADAYRQHRADGKHLQFSSVDLSGDLEVIDPQNFVAVLQHGIGHGKAFGCGLLLVRPA